MTKKSRFIVNHHVVSDGTESNELLVLEPETNTLPDNILFFHGHQVGMRVGAWETPRYLEPLLTRGYRVIAPSILGYGKTTGSPDYCGPNTLQRIEGTVRDYIISPVHVMGASRGGTLAVLFAEHFPELTKSCTTIAGTYDLESMVDKTPDERMRQNILNETGGTLNSYNERNPRTLWEKLKSPLHIVHGVEDEQIPVSQAEKFAHFLQEKGLQPKLTILETSGHKLFSEQLFREVIVPFLENK